MGLFQKKKDDIPDLLATLPKKTTKKPVKTYPEDEPILDDEEEYEEDMELETEEPTEETVRKPVSRTKKIKTVVLNELPTQPYNIVKDKDGNTVKLMSVTDALTRILEILESD